jgi:hypothetical protein
MSVCYTADGVIAQTDTLGLFHGEQKRNSVTDCETVHMQGLFPSIKRSQIVSPMQNGEIKNKNTYRKLFILRIAALLVNDKTKKRTLS